MFNPDPRSYVFSKASSDEVCIGEGIEVEGVHPLTQGQDVVRRIREPLIVEDSDPNLAGVAYVYCLEHVPWTVTEP